MKKKGQNWSLEVVLALGLFMILFVTMITLLFLQPSTQQEPIERVGDSLSSFFFPSYDFESNQFSFVKDNVVQKDRLLELNNTDYESLKDELGIDEDFCIIIEDSDGNITYQFGSGNIQIGSNPCSG